MFCQFPLETATTAGAGLEPGASSGSHMGPKASASAAFPRPLAQRISAHMGCEHFKLCLNLLGHNASPLIPYLKRHCTDLLSSKYFIAGKFLKILNVSFHINYKKNILQCEVCPLVAGL